METKPVEGRGSPTWCVFFIGLAGVLAGTIGIRTAQDPSWVKFFDNLHWTFGTSAAAILGWLGYNRLRFTERSRTLLWFAVGLTLYAAGQLAWDAQTALAYTKFPSPSDLLYIWLGPGLCFGLLEEIRRRARPAERAAIRLDILSFTIASLTLVLALYLPHRGQSSLAVLTVLTAYPTTLIAAACIGIAMIPLLRLRNTAALWLFLSSLAVTAWSWMTWNLMALDGATIDGAWFNVSFSFSILCIGFVISDWNIERSSDPARDRICDGIIRLLPLMSVTAACAAVFTAVVTGMPLVSEEVVGTGSILVILLAAIRQVMSLKERDQLLAAQREIILNRALLRTVVDAAPVRVFWKDRQCRYLGCNVTFAADAGVESPEDLIGRTDDELHWKEQAPLYQADDREVMENGRARLAYEEPQTSPDGGTRWLRTSKVPLKNGIDSVIGVVGVYDDITERKQAEELLRTNLESFRMAQAISKVGNWEYDLETEEFWGSEEAKRIYGFRTGQDRFLVEEVEQCIVERERVHQVLLDLIEKDVPYCQEFEIRPKHSTESRIITSIAKLLRDDEGKPLKVFGVIQDITERKRAEEALHRLNRELRAISNCNQVLMKATDEAGLLSEICRIVCEDAGYRMAWVGYVEHDEGKSIRLMAWAGSDREYYDKARFTWADTERGRGPAGVCIRSGLTDYCQDFTTDPRMIPWRDTARQRGYRSCISLALKDEAATIFGALCIYSSEPNAFTPDEIRLLEELAGDLAYGITALQSRNARKEAERSSALLNFALDTVHEMAFLIDKTARFRYVNEESCRVLGYSRCELLALGVADIDPDFPSVRWSAHWQELASKRCITLEGRHRSKDGHLFPVEINANFIEYDGQHYNLALVRDMTARQLAEDERLTHFRFLESLDRVNLAIQGAHDLEQMMRDVLDQVLALFACDRVFLLYPCAPETPVWRVPMERTRPEYPGVLARGLEMPTDADVATTFRILLDAGGPVKFGPGTPYPLPAEVSEQFGFKSLMAMALFPKFGQPWQFGVHQCSHARTWTQEEERLFQEIGRRLADGMTGLLIHRDLRMSEERYRMVFENSPVSIWEGDFSGVKALFDDLKHQGITDIVTYFDTHPQVVQRCAELVRVIDVNQATLTLHQATNKQELFERLVNTFTLDSFSTFREELICLWHGAMDMIRDAEIKTLSGTLRQVTVYFAVSPGYEESFAKVIVSLVDITERKRIEETLHLQTVELEEEVAERQATQENLQEKALQLEEEIEQRQNAQEALEQLNEQLEQRVRERTAELEEKNGELERMNKMFVGRELRMIELKERIRELEQDKEKRP